METKNEEHPLKIRSARATVAAGIRLYTDNFRRIFRATWLPALVCALVSAFATKTIITAMSQIIQVAGIQMLASAPSLPQQYLVQSGLTFLDAVFTVVLMSYVFSLLASHRLEGAIPYPPRWWSLPDSHSLTRTVASAIVWFVTQVVVGGIFGVFIYLGIFRQSVTLLCLAFVILLIAVLLLLPFVYSHMRYLTTRDTHFFELLRLGYGQGMRHWGYIFTVLFVMMLLLTVALTVTMLPAFILIMANMKSQMGAATGDPLDMPAYMNWVSLVVFTLSGFIQVYVILAIHFPAYYMAGSIEQQEIQRNETAKNTLH